MMSVAMLAKYRAFVAGTCSRVDVIDEWVRRKGYEDMKYRAGINETPDDYFVLCDFMDRIDPLDDDAARTACRDLLTKHGLL